MQTQATADCGGEWLGPSRWVIAIAGQCANALETICEVWSLASSPQGDYPPRRSRYCGFGAATSRLNQGIRQLSLPHRHFALQVGTCRRVGWETIDDHQVHPYGGLADREGLPLCRQRDDGAFPGKPVCGPYRGWVNSPGSTVSPTYRSRATSKTWRRCHSVRSPPLGTDAPILKRPLASVAGQPRSAPPQRALGSAPLQRFARKCKRTCRARAGGG